MDPCMIYNIILVTNDFYEHQSLNLEKVLEWSKCIISIQSQVCKFYMKTTLIKVSLPSKEGNL